MKLNRRNYDRKISKLIRNAKTGYATSALQIVKCDDDFWQNVVLKCMKSADAVIVDVSDINSNVDWELTQIRNFVKPEKLVLCCAARNGKLICDESTLIRNLKAILGQEDFTRSYRIVYELPRDLLGIIGFMERKFRDYGIITALRFSKDHLKLNQVLFLAVVSK